MEKREEINHGYKYVYYLNEKGNREGLFLSYHPNGKPYGRVNYKNGITQGIYKVFYGSGNLEYSNQNCNGISSNGFRLGGGYYGEKFFVDTIEKGERFGMSIFFKYETK